MAGQRGAGASRSSDDLHNEDSFLVADDLGLYAVCDGRGSRPAGEIAAYLAVEAIEDYLGRALARPIPEHAPASEASGSGAEPERERTTTISATTIEAAVRHAVACLLDAGELRPDLVGMDTTLTLLLVQPGRAFIGHRGDSRAYLVRDERLVQLTTDQEWTRAQTRTGSPGDPRVESFSIATRRGDTFILCTDGAEREMANSELIEAIADASPRLVVSRIVSAAHRRDSTVDATAVVVRIDEEHAFSWARVSDPPSREDRANAQTASNPGRRDQRPHLFDRPLARDRYLRGAPSRASGDRGRSRTRTVL